MKDKKDFVFRPKYDTDAEYQQWPHPPKFTGPPKLSLVVSRDDYVLPKHFQHKLRPEPPLFPISPRKTVRVGFDSVLIGDTLVIFADNLPDVEPAA
jgi:hypothetical protein